MIDIEADPPIPPTCKHCHFGLIVTGDGERDFLPELFSSLTARAGCHFTIVTQIDQRGPITEKKRLKMVGSGSTIPDKDESEIGLKARGFLRSQQCRFLVLVDDVEDDRRPNLGAIWERYRTALDTMLSPEEQSRASVHFLANMLEAYYFANTQAVNEVLETNVIAADFNGDVESISHPKNDLKQLAKAASISFDEKNDGGRIVPRLNLDHVLSNPSTCGFLRAMFAWCVHQLANHCPIWDQGISTAYCLKDGIQAEMTKGQHG